MMSETFWTLLRDPAHWLFELFLMVVFDGIVLGVCWPFLRKHWKHHIARDNEVWGTPFVTPDPYVIIPDWSGSHSLHFGMNPDLWPQQNVNVSSEGDFGLQITRDEKPAKTIDDIETKN
jgi:hypothetical protein